MPRISKKTQVLWPPLPYDKWKDTLDTLHLWMQIVGKIKLQQNPFLNQWWEVAFYLTSRGMTTGRIPYKEEAFEIQFDFIDHQLIIQTSGGKEKVIKLRPQTVTNFYKEFMETLVSLGIKIKINPKPSEMTITVPFNKDEKHSSYDKQSVTIWWRLQLQISFILDQFRTDFRGKSSPVQFYWGSFDMNTSRFSSKKLPDNTNWPKGYHFMRYAENEENFSCGFWPGDERFPHPAFYSYIYPVPKKFETIQTGPAFSYFNKKLSECILPYEEVRKAKNPKKEILTFYEATYKEFAQLAGWNIKELEEIKPHIAIGEN